MKTEGCNVLGLPHAADSLSPSTCVRLSLTPYASVWTS